MPSYLDPDFQKALSFDLDWEGRVYENVAGDPGGPTKYGITWIDYNLWRKSHGKTPIGNPTDVRFATEVEIEQIYWERYWLPMKGANLPDPLDQVIFDAAVNCGASRSVQWLQAVLGVTQDGVFGPQTLAATTNYVAKHGQGALINGLLARRTAYYMSRGSWANKFRQGWLNRVNALTTFAAKAMKGGTV